MGNICNILECFGSHDRQNGLEMLQPPTSMQLLLQRVSGLYEDALIMSKRSKTKAALLKLCSLLTTFLIIILGATIAIIAVFDFEEKKYIMVILGSMVALLKSIVGIFNPEYRASIMKQVHVRSRKLARSVMDLIHKTLRPDPNSNLVMTTDVVSSLLANLQKEYDDLELASFMATVAAAQTYVDLRTTLEARDLSLPGLGQKDGSSSSYSKIHSPETPEEIELLHPVQLTGTDRTVASTTPPIEELTQRDSVVINIVPERSEDGSQQQATERSVDQPQAIEPQAIEPQTTLHSVPSEPRVRPSLPALPQERRKIQRGRHWVYTSPNTPAE
jgi:hypothetical protein